VSLDAIWNLPRAEWAALFARIHGWLRPGAPALFTIAAIGESEQELFTDLHGAPVYCDGWPLEVSLRLLGDAGFSVEGYELRDGGYPMLIAYSASR
jgi:hypothetical protein